jgi:hypothetical protein
MSVADIRTYGTFICNQYLQPEGLYTSNFPSPRQWRRKALLWGRLSFNDKMLFSGLTRGAASGPSFKVLVLFLSDLACE